MRSENATANLLKRVKELERRVQELEQATQPLRLIGQPMPQQPSTCGCPPNYACNSIVCPRRLVVSHGPTDGVGFPD